MDRIKNSNKIISIYRIKGFFKLFKVIRSYTGGLRISEKFWQSYKSLIFAKAIMILNKIYGNDISNKIIALRRVLYY